MSEPARTVQTPVSPAPPDVAAPAAAGGPAFWRTLRMVVLGG